MSESHEDILASFQSITGIDLPEAILHLEETNWDLLTAIHRVLPQENIEQEFSTFNASTANRNTVVEGLNNLDVETNVDEIMTVPSSPVSVFRNIYHSGSSTTSNHHQFTKSSDYNESGSSSGNSSCCHKSSQELSFNIHLKYEIHKLKILDTMTVADLKAKIASVTSIPICRQSLTGWIPNEATCTDATVLKTLNLDQSNEVILKDLGDELFMDEDGLDHNSRDNELFTINATRQPDGEKFSLQFLGKQTFMEVKTDFYTLTTIPVRQQVWTGWPDNISGQTTLAQSGIELTINVVLNRATENTSGAQLPPAPSRSSDIVEMDNSEENSSDDNDFQDANDDFNDYYTDTTLRRPIEDLITDETSDEITGSFQFVDNYILRYGDPHPDFYRGSLQDALNEACYKPAKDRKLLAIYLHHDRSVLSHVFCEVLLKCDGIQQTLLHNFILYGWDLTHESNKNMFLSALSACSNPTAIITVRTIPVNHLPAIVIIGKSRSTCEVLSVIHGNCGKDEMLNKLLETINMYSDQRDIEVREENERAAREQVKLEQDVAYNESLEADRRKEEVKLQKERALANEKKRLESERQEIEAVREANRLEAERCVPVEPAADGKGITKIRVRKPTGEFILRRFTVDTKLSILFKFIESQGFPMNEYKVISSFPRRDLTTVNAAETLEHYKLCPQETVILELR
ncbi:FAS-associated factor 1 [Pseudolycoriella hygida]|uniref:FAS-associated factor 1 n=1 Tax=Pseudolycoriella hygida TaxID=35572 RepID=A0A9Q0S3Y8_9DIPT|nr:FAS-associated factor 1 [Pseudolycoriella hygida]